MNISQSMKSQTISTPKLSHLNYNSHDSEVSGGVFTFSTPHSLVFHRQVCVLGDEPLRLPAKQFAEILLVRHSWMW